MGKTYKIHTSARQYRGCEGTGQAKSFISHVTVRVSGQGGDLGGWEVGTEAHSKQRKHHAKQTAELAGRVQITEMASTAGTWPTAGVGVRS